MFVLTFLYTETLKICIYTYVFIPFLSFFQPNRKIISVVLSLCLSIVPAVDIVPILSYSAKDILLSDFDNKKIYTVPELFEKSILVFHPKPSLRQIGDIAAHVRASQFW